MHELKKVKYGVGQQSFEMLRLSGSLYIDKTRYIEMLADSGANYYFLGRPRRFGKSLFLSSLKSFFEGRRDLFKSLYIDSCPQFDWKPVPVLYLDFNTGSYFCEEDLINRLNTTIDSWEAALGVSADNSDPAIRMETLLRETHRATGSRPVVLIDEYDKPLASNLSNAPLLRILHRRLEAFYSSFKSAAPHIRMVFMTGVSRLRSLSAFSGLNNVADISMLSDFNAICGITVDELREHFRPGLTALADKTMLPRHKVIEKIRTWYGGYRFSPEADEIINPYSLMSLMQFREFKNFWINTGRSAILEEKLRSVSADLQHLLQTEYREEDLLSIADDDIQAAALLYQTGYLTARSFSSEFNLIQLDLPNKEVSQAFYSDLLPLYNRQHDIRPDSLVGDFVRFARQGRPDELMTRLSDFFSGISYEMRMDDERNFHSAMFVLCKLVNLYVQTEYALSDGRIDLLISTDRYIYIIELKYDCSARKALGQINEKRYARSFSRTGRIIFKIGANFSSKSRTIADWQIQKDY